MICPNCGKDNPAVAKFCWNCGHALPRDCPQCGADLSPNSRYCFNCGFQVAERQASSPAPFVQTLATRPPRDLGTALNTLRTGAGGDSSRVIGERRVLTALFCDVTGSTQMADQLDPEEWAVIMNGAFEFLIEPVYRYEGTVARLMGDAILAFFGAPVAHEDDPQRAVMAGLEIISGIGPYCDHIKREYGLSFNVRVGINTGPVVVGEIGSELAMEYTAMGDAVNVAARMEQMAEPGTVQISEHTYRLVAPYFEAEPLGGIDIRGKRELISAYRVVGRKAQYKQPRGIEGLSAPLVGRTEEFSRLRGIVKDVLGGRGQIVFLTGEAGLGKTRLVDEMRREWKRLGGRMFDWSESRGIAYEASRPYGLFGQRLQQYFGVLPDDSPDVIRSKVANGVARMPAGAGELLIQAVEILLSIDKPEASRQIPGEAVKRELNDAALWLWRTLGESTPGGMVFDNLQWADPASVELVLHLFNLVEEVPLLFVCAMRPHPNTPGWNAREVARTKYPDRHTEITLERLSDADTGALVDSLLSGANLPTSLRTLILRKAEGNPLFVEEVVRTLIDRGVLVRDEETLTWRVQAMVEDIEIPDNLQALLTARIDRLDEAAQRTLQLAAVIGRSFQYRVLERIAEAGAALDEQLATLERAGLIQKAAAGPEVEYTFRHELTREAAYSSMLRSQRRRFHRLVGETVEELFPNRLEDQADRLAYHFHEAGDAARALKYYRAAGDKAARLYANAEAGSHYTRAIEVAEQLEAPGEELGYLYTRLGRTQELRGQYDKALASYEALVSLGKARGDRSLELAGLLPQATVHVVPTMQFDPRRGKALAEKSLALARELENQGAESEALWNLMLLNYFTGRIEQSLDFGELALQIAHDHDLPERAAYAQHDLARSYMAAGRTEEAWRAELEAYERWEALGNLPMLADSLGTLADGALLLGNLDLALGYGEEGVALSQQIGSDWGEAYNLSTLGMVYIERGDVSRGLEAIRRAMELADRANFIAVDTNASALMAFTYATFGELETALRLAGSIDNSQGARASFEDFGSLVRGFVLARAGEYDEAWQALDALPLDKLPPHLISFYGALISGQLAELELAGGQAAEAIARLDEVLGNMAQTGQRMFLPDVLHTKARALLALDNGAQARAVLEQARDEAVAMQSRRSLWQILLSLAALQSAQGDADGAEATRKQAHDVIKHLAAQMTEPSLLAAFLALPDVQATLTMDEAA